MIKTILVPFSGGMDSTYVVYKNLKDNNIVLPVYVQIGQMNIPKRILEYQQVKQLYKIFSKEFGHKILPITKIDVKSWNGESQFQIWSKAVKNIVENVLQIDGVHFGYVQDDIDEYLRQEDLDDRLKTAKTNIHPYTEFPVLEMTKNQIGAILPRKYLTQTVQCEMPIYVGNNNDVHVHQCGVCNACHTRRLSGVASTKSFKLLEPMSKRDINLNNQEHIDNIFDGVLYNQIKSQGDYIRKFNKLIGKHIHKSDVAA